MVTCTGKSLIPINISAYQSFLNSVVPSAKLPEFNIKLDARSNSKSTFVKLSGVDLTLYTGTIVKYGLTQFLDVMDAMSLFMLFTIYGVKKAGDGISFEIKNSDVSVAEVKADPDFRNLSEKLHFFMEKFIPINTQAISANTQVMSNTAVDAMDSSEAEKSKKVVVGVSPYKGVPLGDTPKITVPENLDLRTV